MAVMSIGPVQSFIAASRKTEDLWAGSYILSHLAAEALKSFPEDEFQAVSPKRPNDGATDIASLPNRILLVTQPESTFTAEQLAQKMRTVAKYVRFQFERICASAVEEAFERSAPFFDEFKQKAKHQAAAAIEVFWAIEPFHGEDGFDRAKAVLERRLASAKNDRVFGPDEQNGAICTVCGEREALWGRGGSWSKQLEQYGKRECFGDPVDREERDVSGSVRRVSRIREGECLCGVCLGKRMARNFYKREIPGFAFPSFPSTLDIAGGGTYVAFLMMDGDDMGGWFSGERRSRHPEPMSPIRWQTWVSDRLARYSRQRVDLIVRRFGGERAKTVYAGGDDVLAILPPERVLQVAGELRKTFGSADGLDPSATSSIALVIAHEKAPLSHVLKYLRQLEKRAKAYRSPDGRRHKDALAIAVMARSGEIHEAVVPWRLESGDWTVDRLNRWVDDLERHLSDTFYYRFAEAFMPLVGSSVSGMFRKSAGAGRIRPTGDRVRDDDLMRTELERLIRRSLKTGETSVDAGRYAEELVELHADMSSTIEWLHLISILTFIRRIRKKQKGGSAEHVV
ncbi:MAG: type III-B CRISPR-associated protein Cas10/Cmr2 [Candidatus Reconcilbacillus cellulovorans]|uniref:Type III-B CRISPR-associated protein Cas10/Cmr2 n=1 Tax=Candidatus Reconcilbacillus cellulovorans TaxID=1906605 RepID=A0A2A6E1D8_9BACL|nr:MAG: type III-B CRISPR-associated protein Cas10/Cmr2 [Candidatus Reconcilbacillus cellulovorans]